MALDAPQLCFTFRSVKYNVQIIKPQTKRAKKLSEECVLIDIPIVAEEKTITDAAYRLVDLLTWT